MGIIEKQFAGEVCGGKVDHLTKSNKKKKAIVSGGLGAACLTRGIIKRAIQYFNCSILHARLVLASPGFDTHGPYGLRC